MQWSTLMWFVNRSNIFLPRETFVILNRVSKLSEKIFYDVARTIASVKLHLLSFIIRKCSPSPCHILARKVKESREPIVGRKNVNGWKMFGPHWERSAVESVSTIVSSTKCLRNRYQVLAHPRERMNENERTKDAGGKNGHGIKVSSVVGLHDRWALSSARGLYESHLLVGHHEGMQGHGPMLRIRSASSRIFLCFSWRDDEFLLTRLFPSLCAVSSATREIQLSSSVLSFSGGWMRF